MTKNGCPAAPNSFNQSVIHPVARAPDVFNLENIMGKYLIAWLLGVPGVILLIFFLFF